MPIGDRELVSFGQGFGKLIKHCEMVTDGKDIVATKDRWLRSKNDFKVDNLHLNEGRNEQVSTLFYPGTKIWDVEKVQEMFNTDDACAILATRVPHHVVGDTIVWLRSNDGLYNVKSGYRVWHDLNIGFSAVPQSSG